MFVFILYICVSFWRAPKIINDPFIAFSGTCSVLDYPVYLKI